MIASTWLDLVVGLDIHFEMVPMPAPVPTPFPHPFVGMVFDPAGLAMGIAISNTIGMAMGGSFKGPVLIWGMPANTTGTEAKNSFVLPHFIIPPGTMWTPMPKAPKPPFKGKTRPPDLPVAPAGDAVMITGSKTVTTMGSNQCRLGDLAMSCAEPVRLPSSAVIAIPKGPIVLVGGPPAVDWVAAAMAFIKTKTIANELHGLVGRIKSPRLRNFCHWLVCTLTGHPVDVATGRVMTRATDWELPGPIPLTFERHYSSAWSNRDSPLGYGWSHSLDQAVWIERGCVVYRAGDGREVEFDTFPLPDHAMRPGDEVWDPFNRLTLRNTAPFAWEVETPEGLTHHFATVKGGDPKVARLTRIADRAGHEVLLTYDPQGRLDYARDAGGRIVRFEHDARGRLVRVALPHPSVEGWVTHTRYAYTDEGELASATDPLGHATRFEYAGEHLLVRESDRCGFSFHFGYDGAGTDARCVRTWGDGGVYDHALFYDPKARRTTVTDSLGNTTLYEFNELNLLVKRTDPLGHAWLTEYDPHGWKTAEVDPLGNATRWAYDPRGRTVETELPDGAKERVAYDAAGDVVAVEDAGGSRWVYERDDAGRLITLLDPVGRRTRYHHGRGGVTRAELPDGRTLRLTYDARLNLTAAGCDGAPTVTARFDRLGRLVERASGGRVESFALDPLGRIVAARGADGEDVAVERDPEGGVTALRDRRGTTRYGYTAFRRLAFEARPHGTVSLRYNTENELVAVENAAGEVHAFERDARGLVVAEVGFDGAVRRYAHDAARRVASARAPGGATTAYSHDARGRLVEARYGDGRAERFVWSPAGALMEAHSADAAVRWERDALGRVVRELQGDVAVESRWGAGARRSAVASSLGARMAIERDGAGDVRAVLAGGGAWRAEFERDERGLERARRFTGGVVATWARDALGRPVEQHVTTPAGPAGSVGFAWSGLERVDARVDAVHGRTIYERDAAGRPARARADDGTSQVRAFDAAGNVYRTEDGSDRAYAPGGAPVRAEGAAWAHDADGNLTERVDPDGARWRYGWGADGRLREVLRPDGVRVEFAYDALGRRTEKRVDGRATRWVWDGDVVLHELEEGAPTRTWYFEPESFVPLALDDGGRWCGAVPDVVGAPSALFDAAGDVAWRAQLDLYGAARADVAEVRCPWRWPGQYEDEETGFYYNRHRYYSPALGAYVSRDPLGLAAGVNARAYVPDPLTACDPLGLIVLQQVPYDGHPLFNAVREYVASRPASELRGRNVAAFQMDDGSIHVRSSQGGGVHSESVLLNEFDHSRVTAVYSERIPCTGRTNCRGALDSALGAEVPVYWTHDMVRGQEGATAKAIEKDRNTFCRS